MVSDGIIVNGRPGPDYRQPFPPPEGAPAGSVWFNTVNKCLYVSNGQTWFAPHPVGYWIGGMNHAVSLNVVDKITFSDGAVSTLSKGLREPRFNCRAFSSSRDGYAISGDYIWEQSIPNWSIDAVSFATEIPMRLSAVVSVRSQAGFGFSSSTYGYSSGGWSPEIIRVSTIDRLDFQTQANARIGATLAKGNATQAGEFSSSQSGYILGGGMQYLDGATQYGYHVKQIEAMRFVNETTTILAATIASTRAWSAGSLSHSLAGYCAGGLVMPDPSSRRMENKVERLTFATETNELISTVISASRSGGAGVSDRNRGYLGGGTNNVRGYGWTPTDFYTVIDTLHFGNEACFVHFSSLRGAKSTAVGCDNVI